MTGTSPLTCLWGGGFVAGSEAIERRVVAVQDHRVDWVSLLQLKQELLHSLDGVVATQVDHHLLDLKQIQIYSINWLASHYPCIFVMVCIIIIKCNIYRTLCLIFYIILPITQNWELKQGSLKFNSIRALSFHDQPCVSVYRLHLHKATVWYRCWLHIGW